MIAFHARDFRGLDYEGAVMNLHCSSSPLGVELFFTKPGSVSFSFYFALDREQTERLRLALATPPQKEAE